MVSSSLELNSMGGSGREGDSSQGTGIILSHLISVLLTHFLLNVPRAVAWAQCCMQGLVARAVHAWDRLPLAVANPGAVDLEAGVSQEGSMCLWGAAARAGGSAGPACASRPQSAGARATGAGPWCSSHALQTWVLLSMRPAKPGDLFRGISGIPCSASLWHERVKAVLHKWLKQSLCVSAITFPGFGDWFSPWWCLCVPGPLARLGWADARHSIKAVAVGTPPKEPPEERVLGCCGMDHSKGEWD